MYGWRVARNPNAQSKATTNPHADWLKRVGAVGPKAMIHPFLSRCLEDGLSKKCMSLAKKCQ